MESKIKQKKQLQTKGSNCDDNDNDNEYDNDNDLEKEKSKRKAFTPPTLEEVEKYVAEKKLKVNAKNFYDYFTVGNWIDKNGNKVKNWKQKILTWNSYADTGKEEKITQREYSEDDFSELYANNKKE